VRFPLSAHSRCDRIGCPLYPETCAVLLQPSSSNRPPRAPSSKGQGPTTPVYNPSPGACCHETSSEDLLSFTRPAYSRPVTHRMDRRGPWAHPQASNPNRPRACGARRGGSRATGALARSHDRHSGLLSRELTQNVRPVSHLEATVRDPSRSGPSAKLTYGLLHTRNHRRRQGDPTPFLRPQGVPRRDMELT
jgi:hypothetical protein